QVVAEGHVDSRQAVVKVDAGRAREHRDNVGRRYPVEGWSAAAWAVRHHIAVTIPRIAAAYAYVCRRGRGVEGGRAVVEERTGRRAAAATRHVALGRAYHLDPVEVFACGLWKAIPTCTVEVDHRAEKAHGPHVVGSYHPNVL